MFFFPLPPQGELSFRRCGASPRPPGTAVDQKLLDLLAEASPGLGAGGGGGGGGGGHRERKCVGPDTMREEVLKDPSRRRRTVGRAMLRAASARYSLSTPLRYCVTM